eukprot:scaffold5026_cov61-Phaeocystis_antarctica.AAC.1
MVRRRVLDASLDELHAGSKLLHISHARVHAPLSPVRHGLGAAESLPQGPKAESLAQLLASGRPRRARCESAAFCFTG